jgi:hypothetical protein
MTLVFVAGSNLLCVHYCKVNAKEKEAIVCANRC